MRGGDGGHGEGVEEGLDVDADAEGGEIPGQALGEPAHPLRDLAQARRSVIDRVHRRHDRQQHLGGADVGRGLVPADMLFAGAEGEPQGGPALRILRDADEAAGHLALIGVARGEKRRVGSAKAQRHAEALRRADRDVGAEFAGRTAIEQRSTSWMFSIKIPKQFLKYVVPIGSIAVDGVSLTIAELENDIVRISIIPHTMEHTIFGSYQPGTEVNLEFDIVGKYIERFTMLQDSQPRPDMFTERNLREMGF